MEPEQRRRTLLGAGATHKQIKAATKAVAQLNQDRWKASEVIFGDTWLFRAPRSADGAEELLAMLGQPDCRGFQLVVANWLSAEACARELCEALSVPVEWLLASTSSDEGESCTLEGDEPDDSNAPALTRCQPDMATPSAFAAAAMATAAAANPSEAPIAAAFGSVADIASHQVASVTSASAAASGHNERIAWTSVTAAMQNLPEQIVLMIRCQEPSSGQSVQGRGLRLLGRLIGCVAQAHINTQVAYQRRGNVSVVLIGCGEQETIEADWSDDDTDELSISPLH